MPGIVGLITRMPREQAEPRLLRMVEAMRHEPFYATGAWIDEASGVYVGWVARKDSLSDGMPLRSERGDVVLVFSGEEFSDPERNRRLARRASTHNGGLAHLLGLYAENGSAFPAGLNGRFHGCVADRSRGTTTLFNDRYGMHRVYYREAKDAFYFAAEAKAILAVCPEVGGIDPRGLSEFITCGSVLENRTLFDGIRVLSGGSVWSFRKGALERKGTYFSPREWEEQPQFDPESYYEGLREVFSSSLPRYFDGPERIAMSLTGGLDTRMIMAWRRPLDGALPCYTFGGARRDCRDVIVAREVARACGQSHEVIGIGEDFLPRFARYAERSVYLTDGCVDVSRAPDLYLNEQAREIAPVRMTGNYGGELLRQVRAFKAVAPRPGLFCRDLDPFLREAERTYREIAEGHPVSFAVFKQAPWHHHGVLSLEQTQLSMRSPYLDNDLVRMAFRAPASALDGTDVCLRLIADGNPALRRIPTDRGVGGRRSRLSSAMSRGISEFLFKAEYGYDMGMPQWVAKVDHTLSPLRLDRLFLGRHKIAHFRVWYRDSLARYVREILLDPVSLARSYHDRGQVEAVVAGHLSGVRNYTNEIHTLLTLELVHRLFVDAR